MTPTRTNLQSPVQLWPFFEHFFWNLFKTSQHIIWPESVKFEKPFLKSLGSWVLGAAQLWHQLLSKSVIIKRTAPAQWLKISEKLTAQPAHRRTGPAQKTTKTKKHWKWMALSFDGQAERTDSKTSCPPKRSASPMNYQESNTHKK